MRKVLRYSPQPSIVGIAASAGTHRIHPPPFNVNQNNLQCFIYGKKEVIFSLYLPISLATYSAKH